MKNLIYKVLEILSPNIILERKRKNEKILFEIWNNNGCKTPPPHLAK
jgi:hypothetical protein